MSADPNAVYAVLSAMAYEQGRRPENLLTDLRPGGAVPISGPLGRIRDDATGFEASAFVYDGRIVIAYGGTLFSGLNPESLADLRADALLGVGVADVQVKQAAEFYSRIRQAYGDNVVFTGHSLGGGLAALMGVFLDKPAITFDPAPFRLAATKSNSMAIAEYLTARNLPVDPALLAYTTNETLTVAEQPGAVTAITLNPGLGAQAALALGSRAYPTQVRGESNVMVVAARGEFLTDGLAIPGVPALLHDLRLKGAAPVIIDNGGAGRLNAVTEMHSINMLAALLIEPRLAALSTELTGFLPAMFDRGLYSQPASSSTSDVWVKLLQRKYAPSDAVDSFAALANDLGKLRGDTGLAQTQVRDALIAVAVEYRYHNGTVDQLFTVEDGRLSFDLGQIIGDGMLSSLTASKALPRLEQALQPSFGADKQYAIYLGGKSAWHVQQGAAAMNFTATSAADDAATGGVGADEINTGARHDLLTGNAGNDVLRAGDGNDILLGGLGGDTLDGGADNDRLLGGAGFDTYLFEGDFGNDHVVDADSDGVIRFGGAPLPQGLKAGDNVWRSEDQRWAFSFMPVAAGSDRGTLVIQQLGTGNKITVREWQKGALGIELSESPAPVPAPTFSLAGDQQPAVDAEGHWILDSSINDNLVTSGPAPDFEDVLRGSVGNDTLSGLGGNDALLGFDGDDVLEGAMAAI